MQQLRNYQLPRNAESKVRHLAGLPDGRKGKGKSKEREKEHFEEGKSKGKSKGSGKGDKAKAKEDTTK